MQKKTGFVYRVKKLLLACIGYSLMGAVMLSPMLLLTAGCYLGGRYFDRKDSTLSSDGIKTTATVFDATYDQLGSLLQGQADNKTNRANYQRDDSSKCTIYYRFLTQDGQAIEGSVNREYASLEAAKSEIGSEIDIVYSAADPTVYETGVGHTNSQSDAMYWIAFAFFALWVLGVIGFMFVPIVEKFKPKSRKKRIEELKKKQKASA